MLSFRLRGVRVIICFGFGAVWALFCLIRAELALPLLLASLIHELGHAAAMCACGQKLAVLRFWGGGILMIPRRSRMLTRRQEILILLPGCMWDLDCGICCPTGTWTGEQYSDACSPASGHRRC